MLSTRLHWYHTFVYYKNQKVVKWKKRVIFASFSILKTIERLSSNASAATDLGPKESDKPLHWGEKCESYLGYDSNLKKQRTQYESTSRTQQTSNRSSYNAAESTEEKMEHAPFDVGLANRLCVPTHLPPLSFSVEFHCPVQKHTQRHRKLKDEAPNNSPFISFLIEWL